MIHLGFFFKHQNVFCENHLLSININQLLIINKWKEAFLHKNIFVMIFFSSFLSGINSLRSVVFYFQLLHFFIFLFCVAGNVSASLLKQNFIFLNLSLCEYDMNVSSHPLQSHCIHVSSPICTATDDIAKQHHSNSFFNVMWFIMAQKAKKMYIKYIGFNLAATYSLVCCWWKANENFHLVIYF